jgi:hypothetical protein
MVKTPRVTGILAWPGRSILLTSSTRFLNRWSLKKKKKVTYPVVRALIWLGSTTQKIAVAHEAPNPARAQIQQYSPLRLARLAVGEHLKSPDRCGHLQRSSPTNPASSSAPLRSPRPHRPLPKSEPYFRAEQTPPHPERATEP